MITNFTELFTGAHSAILNHFISYFITTNEVIFNTKLSD